MLLYFIIMLICAATTLNDLCRAQIRFLYSSTDYSMYIWIPWQDQYQEICISFFMRNLRLSRYDAFSRFLEWYASCLKETAETVRNCVNNSKYEYVDSCDELMLRFTMNMLVQTLRLLSRLNRIIQPMLLIY